jgi:hypothetical protein
MKKMGRITKLQSEIGHLQQKLAERNKTIAANDKAMADLREGHLKEVSSLKTQLVLLTHQKGAQESDTEKVS